jgi:peptidoglycan-associated lipoprotein
MNMKIVGAVAVTLLVAGCASKSQTGPQTEGTGMTDSTTSSVIPGSEQDLAQNVGDRVFFELDHSDLSQEARQTLDRQAAWLKRFPAVRVTLEGHCDERGTREYNLALGARRANAVKEYLVSQGVSAGRLETISYGKERPICTDSNEACWAQNRRGVSTITGGANS